MTWKNEIVGLWPTPIIRKEMGDPSLLTRLAELEVSDNLFAADDAAVQTLHDAISSATQAYFQKLGVDPLPGYRIQGRIEALAYGESRALQNRPGTILSGLLYVQTPTDLEELRLRDDNFPGNLTLYDPRPGFNMMSIKGDPYRLQSLMVEPKPGLLLMWPGAVNFYRHPNLSRTTQICVAFEVLPDADKQQQITARWDGAVHEMWPTGLIKRRLPDYERQNRQLIEVVNAMERENPKLTTDFNVDRFRDNKHPAVVWLMTEIRKSIAPYFKQMGIDYEVSWDMAAWPNINRFGDYHSPHNHPWSYLSGTYYVQIPEADAALSEDEKLKPACISYYDPRPAMNAGLFPPGPLSGPMHTIKPIPGALLIWPSPVYHFIHPNLSSEKRYSISFNIHLNWKDDYS